MRAKEPQWPRPETIRALLPERRALAAHLGANRDGNEPYVEIAELETPLTMPFWLAEPAEGRVLVLQLDQVDAFRHILSSMSRAAR